MSCGVKLTEDSSLANVLVTLLVTLLTVVAEEAVLTEVILIKVVPVVRVMA